MGMAAAILGGGLLGLGAAALTARKTEYAMPTEVHSSMAAGLPQAPTTPEPQPTGNTSVTDNERMEAERERELQQALFRRQQAQEVFTSGLGAPGEAATLKKTLLGG